jgi:hypothetical protein
MGRPAMKFKNIVSIEDLNPENIPAFSGTLGVELTVFSVTLCTSFSTFTSGFAS